MKNKILSILITLYTVFLFIPVNADADVSVSGKCGDNAYWSLDGGTLKITGSGEMYDYDNDSMHVPWNADGYSVSGGNKNITKVTIEDGITEICDFAFSNCINLDEINIPYSVKRIGWAALAGCKSLQYADIPDNLISIGLDAFDGSAFFENGKYVDNNVTYYNNYLMDGYNCESRHYEIKSGTKCISDNAFSYSHLESVTFPDSLLYIGDSAFLGMNNLKEINIHANIQYIGHDAFGVCQNLKKIDVAESNSRYSSVNGVLFDKNKTSLIQYPCGKSTFVYCVPEGVQCIGEYAFMDCYNIIKIKLPDSVTTLEKGAFDRCAMTSIVITDSVTDINKYAFWQCENLKNVYYTGSSEQWNKIDIDDTNAAWLSTDKIYYNSNGSEGMIDTDSDETRNKHSLKVVRFDSLFTDDYTTCEETDLSYKNHIMGFENSWNGKMVLAELDLNTFPSTIYKVELVSEHIGTVDSIGDNIMTIEGEEYIVGRNVSDYKNYDDCDVSFFMYDDCIVGISEIKSYLDDDCKLVSYSESDRIVTLSISYNKNDYYLSPNSIIGWDDIAGYQDKYVHLKYDGYENIFNMVQTESQPSKSYYKTESSTPWDFVQYAANDFVHVSEAYMEAVLEVLDKKDDYAQQEKNARYSGALKLKGEDDSSKSKMLTFGAIPEDGKIYAYEALYDAFKDLGDKAIDLGKINMDKDSITVGTDIVNDIIGGIYSKKFTNTYGDYNMTVDLTVFNFADNGETASANFGSIVCRTKAGKTVDVITVCSSQKQLANVMEVYFNQLKLLDVNAMNEAMSAIVEDLSGKSIDDWGKWGIKNLLNKHKKRILLKGAGDVYSTAKTCSSMYSSIKKIYKAKDKTPEKQMDVINSVYEDAIKIEFNDSTITDKLVEKLYKKVEETATKFKETMLAYLDGEVVGKNPQKEWVATVNSSTNVYVYDKNGIEVGHIIGNDIEYNEEIYMEKLGNTKKIYLSSVKEYEVKIVGTDEGTFDYTVEQYNGNNSPIGRICFTDKPISVGKEYTATSESDSISSSLNVMMSNGFISSSSNVKFLSSDDCGVTVLTRSEGNGTVIGGGSYVKGDNVILTALPYDDFCFDGWYVDGTLVSENYSYTLYAVKDITVTAKFSRQKTLKMTGLTDSDDGYTACFNIQNHDRCDLSGVLYIALYGETGNLKSVVSENIFLDSEDATLEFNKKFIAKKEKNDHISMYLWTGEFEPLSDEKIYVVK